MAPRKSWVKEQLERGSAISMRRVFCTKAPAAPQEFVFTVFGDHGVGKISKANVELALAEKPAFHLILGDLSYAKGKQKVWETWFEQLEPMSRAIPVMPALGNHEDEKGDRK